MTVTVERSPLGAALKIPGACAVALLDVADGATLLWRAGDRPPGEREAATAVALAVSAAELVALDDPDDELGDVLVASAATFHVLRLVGDGAQVAHLTLRRDRANLAMARQEFKLLADAHGCLGAGPATAAASPPTASPPTASTPTASTPTASAASAPGSGSLAPGLPGPGPGPAPGPPGPAVAGAALPRRRPNGVPVAAGVPPAAGEADEASPGWLTMLGQPYHADERVLDRILITLRHL